MLKKKTKLAVAAVIVILFAISVCDPIFSTSVVVRQCPPPNQVTSMYCNPTATLDESVSFRLLGFGFVLGCGPYRFAEGNVTASCKL